MAVHVVAAVDIGVLAAAFGGVVFFGGLGPGVDGVDVEEDVDDCGC